ncbi:unnamed protein product [Cyprideis torosa]|uniref:Uncharacterized protein n=1 Tax=Cyprideis torosa TaxID=163714 RepID=A0A7R8W3H4_9CRUS|nr:unnamed protein product [Cyprideis torosa]CAG0879665.1 unnamed protein product [Cyprideis torosa]
MKMEIHNFIVLWITSMAWIYIDGACRIDLATDRTIEHNGACFYVATSTEVGAPYRWIDAEKHCQNNLNGHMALADYDLLVKAAPMIGQWFWLAPHRMPDLLQIKSRIYGEEITQIQIALVIRNTSLPRLLLFQLNLIDLR